MTYHIYKDVLYTTEASHNAMWKLDLSIVTYLMVANSWRYFYQTVKSKDISKQIEIKNAK